MRILFLTERFPPDIGGLARSSSRITTSLASLGHEVHVVAGTRQLPPGSALSESATGITLHRLGLFAAAGIGGYYSDSNWGDKPFYAFRAGVNFEVLPRLYLDINADYRFEDWSGLKASDINSDTITVGAAARFAF